MGEFVGTPLPDSIARDVLIKDSPLLASLRHRIALAEGRGDSPENLQGQWERLLHESREHVSRRRNLVPRIDYALDLPILRYREEIIRAIREFPVTIVAGETGSGKSTQLPKFCLEAGFGVRGLIGHTQPRRLAARTIAARLASELNSPIGGIVGYKIRFQDKTAPNTLIKLMTDGILLAETQTDRRLEQYDVILIDEAHERSLNVDFLLGYIHRLLPSRPDLRLVITSATIDVERFRDHFSTGPAPVPLIQVEGRSYPVEIRYRPPEALPGEREADPFAALAAGVRELAAIDQGHILVFLPTERDIREASHRLRGVVRSLPRRGASECEILALYARLSEGDQQRIFQPFAGQRIVLATNVAESSLTVPGIKYVIDAGLARISRYSPRSKVQRLPIEAISQASANQRAGRCGRLEPGICLRLFSEDDFQQRSPYASPEIQRTNLAAVILRAKALDLGSVEKFPFLDHPRPETIRDGYKTLIEIGALDEERKLTPLGKQLAHWPVDPRIARILVAGAAEGCLPEILVIASALELQDPRERPPDRQQSADERHARFRDPDSDFVSLLRVWDFYHGLKLQLSKSRRRKACSDNMLSFNRLREWTEIHRQLRHLVAASRTLGRISVEPGGAAVLPPEMREGDGVLEPERYAAVHRALLAGFLSGIAQRAGEYEYSGAGGIKFQLWPGSGLFAQRPKWCMAAEIIETSRRYGRTVARIDPEWIEPLAEHLVARSYSDPHWHHKQMTVMAFERVTLFGIPIVERRRVPYGPIDPAHARELFLREGLRHDATTPLIETESGKGSQGNPEIGRRAAIALSQVSDRDATIPLPTPRSDRITREPFFKHNEEVLLQATKLAAKYRRGEYFVDDYTIRGFYNARIPIGVYDYATLQMWMRGLPRQELDHLKMELSDFHAQMGDDNEDQRFPDELRLGEMTLPVAYQFAPDQEDDGVTITVPEDALRQLQPGQTDWLVPGLIEEKITALIRCLPKSIRTNFIPAPDVAKRLASQLRFGEGDFLGQLIQKMNLLSDEPIRLNAFDMSKLPPHLRMNFRIIDADGIVRAQGRDLPDLRASLTSVPTAPVVSESFTSWNRTELTTWDWDELPRHVHIQRGRIEVPLYPAVIDEQIHVRLQLVDSPAVAQRLSRAGIRRLLAILFRKTIRAQVSWLPSLSEMALQASGLIASDRLREQVGDLIVDRAFFGADNSTLPGTRLDYAALQQQAGEKIAEATQDVARILPKLFAAYHQCRLALESSRDGRWRHVSEDVARQLELLLPLNFLTEIPWRWLQECPRYLRGVAYRLERLSVGTAARDAEMAREVRQFQEAWNRRRDEHVAAGIIDNELELYRWMIEEYRVSLFAQPLGTSFPVSAKRLEKQWAKVR